MTTPAKSESAAAWAASRSTIQFGRIPRIMAILNVTPDSFSDGGNFFDPAKAVERGLQLISDGADLLDIGGESTRPYSSPVELDEELGRVVPVIEQLAQQTKVPISVDTSKAAVARAAIDAGAQIINDVTGLDGDPDMIDVAVQTGAGVCAMHMQGTPQTMQDNPQYQDVVEDVLRYLQHRKSALLDAGLEPEKICLDPGIGFGKTHEHNWRLLRECSRFHELNCPILIGHSRKGFIGKALGNQQTERDSGTLAITIHLAERGIHIVRVHEVARTRRALTVWENVHSS